VKYLVLCLPLAITKVIALLDSQLIKLKMAIYMTDITPQIFQLLITFLGKAADPMKKYDIDWFPTLNLGRNKIDVAAVLAANKIALEREARVKDRNVKMNSTVSSSTSTSTSTLVTDGYTPTTCMSTSTYTTTDGMLSASTFTSISSPFTTTGTSSTFTTTGTSTSSILVTNPSDSVAETADNQTQTPTPPKMSDKAVQTDDDNFFCETNFTSDDAKVHYYTGLATRLLLLRTFELVMGSLAHGDKRSYYWRSFMIVLMKLRLNLGLQDIAYRLGICTSTVGRHFHEMLDIMSCHLEWLIKWPE